MMRAAPYIRMSKDDQESSPDRQRSQIYPYCEKRNYTRLPDYIDEGEKGWDITRSDFRRLLSDAKNGALDVIVLDELSRLSRSDIYEFMEHIAIPLRKAGIRLETVGRGPIDWDDIGQILMTVVDQDSTHKELRRLAWRVLSGQREKIKSGRPLYFGPAPYGFVHVNGMDESKKRMRRIGLKPDDDNPEKIATVRFVFDAYGNRDSSVAAIAQDLNTRGVPSPMGGQWCKAKICRMLKTKEYCGHYTWGKVLTGRFYRLNGRDGILKEVGRTDPKVERVSKENWLVEFNQHEAIIEQPLFDRCQELLIANRVRTSKSRLRHCYPFSGLVKCCDCGHTMYGDRMATNNSAAPIATVYRCAGFQKGVCGRRTIREKALIAEVARCLEKSFLNPDAQKRLREEIKRQSRSNVSKMTDQETGLRKAIAILEKKIARAEENILLIEAVLIPKAKGRLAAWRHELATAQHDLGLLRKPSAAQTIKQFYDLVRVLAESIREASPDDLRRLLRSAISRIDIEFGNMRRGQKTFHPWIGGKVVFQGCPAEHGETGMVDCRPQYQVYTLECPFKLAV